jgi:hypothetical protein
MVLLNDDSFRTREDIPLGDITHMLTPHSDINASAMSYVISPKREWGRWLLLILSMSWLLNSAGRATAQLTTADILGTVTDNSGAVISDANVTIENLGTRETRTAKTNSRGEYDFTLLPIGNYSIKVDMASFVEFSATNLAVQAGDRYRVDVHLQIGQVAQQVVVTGTPPALQTDASTISTVIGQTAVENLPTNGRNFINLAQLVPGANTGTTDSIAGGTRPDDRRLTSEISINGQSSMVNSELIDGMDNNERIVAVIGVRPSIDAIAEFRVETNLYTAEVGRTSAGVINVLTKSGTNGFHGSAFEFLRNDKLDASNFFAVTKPELRQNQFGGSLGGPIKKNRLFFFGDYEGLRIVQGTTSVVTVPTLFEEQNVGNFSDNVVTVNGITYPGPILPTNQINAITRKYFALYPAPNLPGFVNNYGSSPNGTQFEDIGDFRLDEHLNDSNLFFVRYTINQTDTDTPPPLPAVDGIQPGGNIGGYDGTAAEQQQNVQLNYEHIFTPAVILELKAGYVRINNQSLPLNYGSNAAEAFGIPGVNYSPSSSALTPLTPTGYASVGDGEFLPLQYLDNTFQYMGSLSWNKGTHSIKIGAALTRRQATVVQSSSAVGAFSFTGVDTRNAIDGGSACTSCGMADLLTGVAFQAQRGVQLYPTAYRTWEPNVYFQDDWRVTPSLTLNLGIRYDLFTPYTEKHNRLSNLDLATGQLVVAGLNGVSKTAGVITDYRNLAPRVGFAWTLGHTTVLRGGFGISFFPDNFGTSGGDRQNQPFVSNFGPVFTYSISNGLPIPGPSDYINPTGSIASAMAPNFGNAYMYQTSLTLEKELGNNVASLSYVGDTGRHLAVIIPNYDTPVPSAIPASGSSTDNDPFQARRPFFNTLPNISSIGEIFSSGVSYYNAFEAELQRRYHNGLTFNANYTFAHMMDDSTDLNAANEGGYGLIPNEISTYDYGNSDTDIRHRFAVSAAYDLPFGKHLHGVANYALSNWQTNAIAVWQTGLPLTVTNSVAQINTGVSTDRPNVVGNPHLSNPDNAEYFNVAAYAPQAFGSAGDSGRNTLHGPHFRHGDFSLFKTIPLQEDFKLQFRAEVFNISNTPSFANPNSSINSAGVGTISSTSEFYTPREIQFALKLLF